MRNAANGDRVGRKSSKARYTIIYLSVIKSADSGRNSVESDYASDVSLFNDDFSGRMRPTRVAAAPLLPLKWAINYATPAKAGGCCERRAQTQ